MNVKTLTVTTREAWRRWLARNHARESEVWLIYAKKESGKPRIPYDDAVEEALCFGWIDGLVKRVDEIHFMQRFTPRRPGSKWAASNRTRYARLVKEGRMTPAGLAKPPSDKPAGYSYEKPLTTVPAYIAKALKKTNFNKLPPGKRRLYVHWIDSAKKEETKLRRLNQLIGQLEK